MKIRKRWRIKKPNYVDVLLKVFLTALTIVWSILYVVILWEFNKRDVEIKDELEMGSIYMSRFLANRNEEFLTRDQEKYTLEQSYLEYQNTLKYYLGGEATAILDNSGNQGSPSIVMDNKKPFITGCFYSKMFGELDSPFAIKIYEWYGDDPELMGLFQKAKETYCSGYRFESKVSYINEETKQFIPIDVTWIKEGEQSWDSEVIDVYTRKMDIPDGFVEMDANKKSDFISLGGAMNYHDINDSKWYEEMIYARLHIEYVWSEDAINRLLAEVEKGEIQDGVIRDFWGNCYRRRFYEVELMNEKGELVPCTYVCAIQYNLWKFFAPSLLHTAGMCAFLTFIFSYVFAFRIYAKQYAIWQQNAFGRTLANAVAHDLKTPLMVISTMADNLKECVSEEKPLYYAEQVTDTVQYMNQMIEDILDLNRVEGDQAILRKEKVDLHKLLEEIKEKVEPIIQEKNLFFTIDGEGQCKGDYTLLRQAFGNLIDNAVKYTPNGESIAISIAKRKVTIVNTGVTLPKKFLGIAFDVFSKADEARGNRKGSGVGLTIARNIFEAHNMKCFLFSDARSVSAKVRW